MSDTFYVTTLILSSHQDKLWRGFRKKQFVYLLLMGLNNIPVVNSE